MEIQNTETEFGLDSISRPYEAVTKSNKGLGQGAVSRALPVSKDRLSQGLGWFSIGLGLAELLIPDRLAKFIGAPRRPMLFRALGLREITSGIGILTQSRRDAWMWSRVGGDAIDLALLGVAFTSSKAETGRLVAATSAVAGVAALDVLNSLQYSRNI